MDSMVLSDKECANILCTAIEGGSNYWLNDFRAKFLSVRNGVNDVDYTGVEVKEHKDDPATPVRSSVGYEDIRKAVGQILMGEIKVRKDLVDQLREDAEACDADAADVVLQVAMFNEIVFG